MQRGCCERKRGREGGRKEGSKGKEKRRESSSYALFIYLFIYLDSAVVNEPTALHTPGKWSPPALQLSLRNLTKLAIFLFSPFRSHLINCKWSLVSFFLLMFNIFHN